MCNCKKNVRKEPQVTTSVPQTPEELHAQDMQTYIDNLPQQVQEDKEEN